MLLCPPELEPSVRTGVGDVFSALVLAHFDSTTTSHPVSFLASTAERAIASLSGIIRNTRAHAYSTLPRGGDDGAKLQLVPASDESAENRVARARHMELRLVQSQADILNPVLRYPARPL
jgi:pyridoxine kinase